jgi:NifU-like protein involved in Fe-S cluster formation
MSADKILDYDKLVAAYNVNLDATLRGFRPAEEMLDTWVPDDDPARSLSSLVEAAQLCGSDSVAVRVANTTLADTPLPALKEKLASLGELEVTAEPDAQVFTISKLQETASFRSVRPVYQAQLRARFGALRFRRPLNAGENAIPLRATEDRFTLAWSVQLDNHVIRDAVFETERSGPMLAVLDELCELLIGLPVLEARDHAVVRLEASLRDPRHRHAIPGIILPQNADPVFRLPSVLVNRLFDDYLTSTQYAPGMNFFDPGPRPAWAALSPAERQDRVTAAVAANRASLRLQNGEVQVVDCNHAYAVTVRFGDGLNIAAKRKLALALERVVRQHCDPRLEVFCEEKKDLSKLRRLTEKAS